MFFSVWNPFQFEIRTSFNGCTQISSDYRFYILFECYYYFHSYDITVPKNITQILPNTKVKFPTEDLSIKNCAINVPQKVFIVCM